MARLGDGLVALPADARTREHLDWLADEIVDSGGTATIWLARPATAAAERELAAGMAADRDHAHAAVHALTDTAPTPAAPTNTTATGTAAPEVALTAQDPPTDGEE